VVTPGLELVLVDEQARIRKGGNIPRPWQLIRGPHDHTHQVQVQATIAQEALRKRFLLFTSESFHPEELHILAGPEFSQALFMPGEQHGSFPSVGPEPGQIMQTPYISDHVKVVEQEIHVVARPNAAERLGGAVDQVRLCGRCKGGKVRLAQGA
jgi:hypothetical protein